MPIQLADILEHKNPNYPIVDATSLKGNTYPISELSETGSIPSEKRKEGMIVFVQDENEYYGFIGDVASEWEDSTKWKSISGAESVTTELYRQTSSETSTSLGPGWITVATNISNRRHGEVIVSDSESGDHAFIRIDWMRSYADSNFTVLNVGGHQNRITGVRVLENDENKTYGVKKLQVYVTVESVYGVRVNTLGTPKGYSAHTAVAATTVENTIDGYTIQGNALTDLNSSSLAAEEGLTVGGDIAVAGTVDGVDISELPTSFAPTDAEKNIQADWNETTTTSDAFIQNKPNTFAPSAHNHDNTYRKLSGGTLTGNLTLNSANPEILFNGTSDLGVDMAIKATPEGLDFYEPEDNNTIHFQILDGTGVNSKFGLQVGGTSVISSERVLKNVTGNISMFTNDSNYITSYTDNDVSIANLKTRLAGGFADNAVTIGDSTDIVTIPGDLVVTGTTTTNNVETVSTSNGVVFEGNVADALEGTLLAGTLSEDRTYTLPDRSGTVMITNEKSYLSLTGNTGEWFTLFQITDQMGPINCKMYTYAHDCVEFNVAEGYNNPSNDNSGSITIINSVQNPNNDYATTKAVRINNDGYVEVQLAWGSSDTNPKVNIGVIVEGYQAPTLYATLETSTETAPISDSVDVNKTGLLRSKSHLIIGGTSEDTSTNTIKLSSEEDSYINNSKNFGIGTDSPEKKLHVSSNDQSNARIRISNTSTSGGGNIDLIAGINNVGQDGFSIYNATSNQTQLVVLGNGNVGIGTDSPDSKLEVLGIADLGSNGYQIRTHNSVGNKSAIIHRKESGGNLELRAESNDYDQLFLKNGGNVGIGTASPGQKLEVEGNIRLSKSNDVFNGLEIGRDSNTLNSFIIQRENADLFIRTNNTDRIRIKSDGKVGIGTAEPDEKLHINNGRILINDNSTPIITKRSTIHRSWVHHIANDSSYIFAPSTENGGNTWDWGNTFKIGVNGDGRFKGDVTANDFITTSDRRIKSNIQEIENGLDVIKQFTSYEYEKEGRQDAGFIAQEVAEAIPYAVFTDDKGMLSMSDRPVLAHMHKAILELEKRIKSIENKLN